MKNKIRISFLLLFLYGIPMQGICGTAGQLKKIFKARPKQDGKLYFIRDFEWKIQNDKQVSLKADFTYNYSSLRDNDSIVMNFTVLQNESIRNIQQVAIINAADTIFSNHYSVRYFTEPEGDHWKNRHSVIVSRKGFYGLLKDASHSTLMLQYDGKRVFCKVPSKYARVYAAIYTIMTVETQYPVQ